MERIRKSGEKYRPYIDRFHNHPYAIPVTTFLVLFFVSIASFIGLNARTDPPSDSHIIEFSVDGKRQSIPTRSKTVGEFLEKVGVGLEQNDIVEPIAKTRIDDEKFHINIYRARPVTIVEEGEERRFAYSAATTPRSVARQAGIEVYPEDRVELELPDSFLREGVLGEKVVIDRSTPANINLYGSHVPVRTHARTVRELLAEKNIQVASKDTIRPSLNTSITPNLQIFVIRRGTKLVTIEERIPMPVETVEDSRLSFGVQVLRQEGSPGKKAVTYQIILRNGKEVGRKKIQEVVSVEAVKQIIARGKAVYIPADKTQVMRAAGISSSDFAYVDFIMARESGWCPTKVQGQIGTCPAFPPAAVPEYGGYGIGQATPGSKMAAFGSDWQSNIVTQLKWANSYAKGRSFSPYGNGWYAAYQYWQANTHW